MAEDFKTAQPREFYKQFLKENVRPDGRSVEEYRECLLNVNSISTAEGSSIVRLGDSMVVCGVKAELAHPSPEDTDRGCVVPNVSISAGCSSRSRPGPPSDRAQVLAKFLDNVVRNSDMFDLSELCISPNKLCWCIWADLVVTSDDGNLEDAALMALVSALVNTRLPTCTINEETLTPELSATDMFALNVRNRPVATTTCLFDENTLLLDPNQEEEDLALGFVTVVVGDDDRLCAVSKPGGMRTKDTQLELCIERAQTRAKQVHQLIEQTKVETMLETVDVDR